MLKEISDSLGKEPGDEVRVSLEEDLEPRTVETAADLLEPLDAVPGLPAYYQALSYSRKLEYHMWIGDAKRPGTRRRRIDRLTAVLSEEKCRRSR